MLTRWELNVARYPMASMRLVLPIPLEPYQDRHAGAQLQVNLCVASEIRQRKMFEVHAVCRTPAA